MKKAKNILKLLIVISFFLTCSNIYSKEAKIHETQDEFTINYDNVSIIEYIHFVSKITGYNFIYNAEDLPFTVTIVSNDPITKQGVMGSLIQILRVHKLSIIESDNSFIISKDDTVKELAPVVDDESEINNPYVTRIFSIKNANVETVSSILRPMISDNAILEVSLETRQIIITDVTTNILKIFSLIERLDSDENPLQIASYEVKANPSNSLIVLTEQIISPLTAGNPFILVAQDTSNLIFIVSTPALVQKALTILGQLDITPQTELKTLENQKVFIYKPVNRSADDLRNSLEQIADSLKESGFPQSGLIETIGNMKWIQSTQSFTFSGTDTTISRLQTILTDLDTPVTGKKEQQTYFLYKLQNVSGKQVEEDLEVLASKLRSQDVEDEKLLYVIENAKWVQETNSILLTGDTVAIDEAKNIIEHYDQPRKGIKGSFFMYSPKFVSTDDVVNSFKNISSNLQNSGLADPALIESIRTMKIVESTNSVVFTGNDETLDKIKTLLQSIDVASSKQAIQKIGKTNFWIFKIQKSKPQTLMNSIKSIADDLSKMDTSNIDFISALKSMKYVRDTNSLVFTGTQEALERLKPLVESFDIAPDQDETMTYYVYKPKYLTGPDLEKILNEFAEQIKVTGVENEPLYEAIESMKYTESTKSLVFTGEVGAIEEIKGLLSTFDIASAGTAPAQDITGLEDLGFLVYKLQFHKGNEIQQALKQISTDLKTGEGDSPDKLKLLKAINSIQWIQITNSLLCSGDQETLAKLKELIANLDVPLKQVFIEVLIINTTLANALNFGLDWASKFQYKDKAVTGIGNTNPTNTTFSAPFNQINNSVTPTGSSLPLSGGFDLGVIGDLLFHKGRSFLSLGSLLQALQTDTETSIVMTPKIITQDGKTSKIFSGTNFPYTGSVVSNTTTQGGNTLITTNIEYRDVGMNLTITPILGNSDVVTLSIDLESSSKPGDQTVDVQLGAVTGITTTKTIMTTSVHVPNKNFLVLSGMVQDTKARTKTGIPCLGGLPIIGAAFSSNIKNDSRNNIVIFLRPHIINSYKDMLNITENQEDYFREQTGTAPLERDFDEAIESIKSFEDE
ncbi:MAG: hypothetical protein JXA94_07195 [Parachlamydiales bacterium]|nr:hypothetical protein [Parachlamydiales bacterium]